MHEPTREHSTGGVKLRQWVHRHFDFQPWNPVFRALVFLCIAATAFSSASAVQEIDRSLREFSAPTPAELYHMLSFYIPVQESQPTLDSDQIDELERKGREFLSSMTPEQQERALLFAKKYLGQNGFDSPASKALMDQFGVPRELQQNLTQQFNAINGGSGQDLSSFKDSVRQATEQALKQARQQENRSGGEQNANEAPSVKPFDSSKQDRSPGGREPSQSEPESADQAESNPPETGQRAKGQPANEQASPDQLDPTQPQQDAFDQVPGSESSVANGKSKPPSGKSNIPKRRGERSRNESSGQDPFQDLYQPDAESESTGTELPVETSPSEDQPGSEFDWVSELREIVGRDKLQAGKEITSGSDNGGQNGSFEPGSQAMEGMQKALEKFANKGPSSFDGNLLNRIGETLSGPTDEAAVPKERLTARFDRLLFDAATRSLESKTGDGSGAGMNESVESMFDKFVDKFQRSAKKNKRSKTSEPKATQQQRDWRSSNNRRKSAPMEIERNRSVAKTDSTTTPQSIDLTEQSKGASSGDTNINLFDSTAGLPKIEPKHAFTFVAVIGLILFLAYLTMRTVTNDSTKVTSRKFGNRFRKSRIQSPDELVAAVDHFLIIKFGSDSRWWNASHARNIMCAGAPEFSAKISELIRDYVRARYMRSDVVLSENEQLRHKTILQELSRLSEKPVLASATETEG